MFQVVKRDGRDAEFQLTKIDDAIIAAFNATNVEFNNDIVDMLALRVTSDFQEKVDDGKIHVEDIQDSVENVLEQAGYHEAAKAYILYRKQHEKMRNMNSTILDYKKVVDSYVKVEDWRVKENSTVTYSVGGLILNHLGRVPRRKEEIVLGGLNFVVLRADRRRLYTLLVTREQAPDETS